jgi:GNAT superfamily N-acetyltransferase
MWWRLPAAQWSASGNAGNRAAFARLVASGEPTGLLAFDGPTPVGWMALAPRSAFPRLLRSRTLALDPGDNDPGLWSVNCFFIHRDRRSTGVATELLAAAPAYAKRHRVHTLEGYPTITTAKRPGGELFTGTVGLFEGAGFVRHGQPTGSRLVMRRGV